MIGAAVVGGVAQPGAAVAAHVGVGVQHAVDVAGDDHALAGDVDDASMAGRQRVGVAGVEPSGVEDPLALGLEHVGRAVVVAGERRAVLSRLATPSRARSICDFPTLPCSYAD